MAMADESEWGRQVTSLLQLSARVSASSIDLYGDVIQTLPPHLKNRLLLMLTQRGKLTNSALKYLAHSRIKKLDLSLSDINDECLKTITVCSDLRELNVNSGNVVIENISPAVLVDLFPRLPLLNSICIRRCLAVTDDVIESLVKSCPNLTALDAGGCTMVTDRSLKAIGECSTKLIALSVSRSQITDEGISALVMKECGKSLTELRIDGCQGVTDEAIQIIVMYCVNLNIFIFHNCRITDQSRDALDIFLSRSSFKQLSLTVH